MGLLNGLFGTPQQNQISDSIMPIGARNEIMQGKLPAITANQIFLKSGETCYYLDKAILNEHTTQKVYNRGGGSAPGLFKGTRVYYGQTRPKEYETIKQHKGVLYITNKRIVFQAREKGFEKQHRYLTAVAPYLNAIELQYGEKTMELIVPDGNIVNAVLQMVM